MKSLSERRLMRACAKFILGEASGVTIKGSQERVSAFRDVLTASRNLYEALRDHKPLSEVKKILDQKHAAAEVFMSVTGCDWHL